MRQKQQDVLEKRVNAAINCIKRIKGSPQDRASYTNENKMEIIKTLKVTVDYLKESFEDKAAPSVFSLSSVVKTRNKKED